jgi:methylated-DNA-[protein]-cysteine S-methyltransferase
MSQRATVTASLPLGPCLLEATERGLAAVRLLGPDATPEPGGSRSGGVLRDAERQLREYFAGRRQTLDLPLDLSGRTEFQRRVLEACQGIGYGETVSYGELALRAGHPGAARAVGQVMATNRLALVVPCHRVVASGGGLGGYGLGLGMKQALLAMERRGGGWSAAAGDEPASARA